MSAEESRVTAMMHVGCGGIVLASLDADVCARCGKELAEEEWFVPGQEPRQVPGIFPDYLDVDVRSWPTGLPGGTP